MPSTTNSILLVDDSTDDEYLLRRTLRLSGLANPVILVGDGEEAIAYLKGEAPYADREKHPLPHVVMLDLKLPGMSGFDVLKWIKDQPALKELLVVVISQHDQVEQIRRAYDLGANSFLSNRAGKRILKTSRKVYPPRNCPTAVPLIQPSHNPLVRGGVDSALESLSFSSNWTSVPEHGNPECDPVGR